MIDTRIVHHCVVMRCVGSCAFMRVVFLQNKYTSTTETLCITLKIGQIIRINIKFESLAVNCYSFLQGAQIPSEKSPGKISNWTFVWKGFHVPFLNTRFWGGGKHIFVCWRMLCFMLRMWQ